MLNWVCGTLLGVLLCSYTCSKRLYIAKESLEDDLLSELVTYHLDEYFTDCSLGIGMDHQEMMSSELQQVLIRSQVVTYRPAVLSRMDSFHFDYRDYPWIWRPEHLLSFRTQPPELRGRLWPGGSCAFNLILSRNGSALPQLIMSTANSFMIRNLYDPVLIHIRDKDHTQPENWLLKDPLQGIRLKLLSHLDSDTSTLAIHTVCYCCKSGQNRLNFPANFSKSSEQKDLFPSPTRDMNGKSLTVGYIDKLDIKHARLRKANDEYVSCIEEFFMIMEYSFNVAITLTNPGLLTTEVNPNGSLTGISHDIMAGNMDWQAGAFFSDTASRATQLSYPCLFLQPGIVTRTPRPDIKWYLVVQPFEPPLWIALFCCILLASFVLSFLDQQQRGSKLSKICTHMTNLLGNLVERPLEYTRDTNVRIFIAFYLVFSMVIGCLYKTKLVMMITFPEPEVLPRNIQELHDSKMTWGTTYLLAAFYSMALEHANSPLHSDMIDMMMTVPDLRGCMERTQSHAFACVILDAFYDQERDFFLDHKGHPKTLFLPEENFKAYSAPAYGRDDVHFADEDRVLQRLLEARVVNQAKRVAYHGNFVRNYFRISRQRNNFMHGSEEVHSLLSLYKMTNVFGLWLVGLAASWLAFGYEKYCNNGKMK